MPDINYLNLDSYIHFQNSAGVTNTIKVNLIKSRESVDSINLMIDNWESEEKKEFELMNSTETIELIEDKKPKEIITNPILCLEL